MTLFYLTSVVICLMFAASVAIVLRHINYHLGE